jgi:hypothetical protein
MEYYKLLMEYLNSKYPKIDLKDFDHWMIDIDREFLRTRWTSSSIITIELIVTVFAIFKHLKIGRNIRFDDFKGFFHVILFVALSYGGPEISYYPRHFIHFETHDIFYKKCLMIINKHHNLMYKINTEPIIFNDYKKKLKDHKEYIQKS